MQTHKFTPKGFTILLCSKPMCCYKVVYLLTAEQKRSIKEGMIKFLHTYVEAKGKYVNGLHFSQFESEF